MQISFGVQNVEQLANAQKVKGMVAVDGLRPNEAWLPTDSIEDLTDYLKKYNKYNFPQQLRDLAQNLGVAYNKVKLLQAEFNLMQKTDKVNDIKLKSIERQLHLFGKKTEGLFNQLKEGYISWYDKNVPEKEKIQIWNYNYYWTAKIYNWFKDHAYNYSKGDIVVIKVKT